MSGMKIKIWYASGVFEEINAPEDRAGELAVIYAEAKDNTRVVAGELHSSRWPVLAFSHRDEPQPRPGTCGRRFSFDRDLICLRVPGHLGRHWQSGGMAWGDNESVPVDSTGERG